MGWTSGFPEITETRQADAFEMTCSGILAVFPSFKRITRIDTTNLWFSEWCRIVKKLKVLFLLKFFLMCAYFLLRRNNYAKTWQNQQNECVPSEDSTQSDQSLLCTHWVAKDLRFLHADSEDSAQTGQMLRLIWVFAGRTISLLVLSCHGSIICFALVWLVMLHSS